MDLQRLCCLVCSLTCLVPCSYAYRYDQLPESTLQLFSDARGSITMKTESMNQSENPLFGKKATDVEHEDYVPDECYRFRSFIISVNSEFVTFSEEHVLNMMVNAIDSLPQQAKLPKLPPKWPSVVKRLKELKIDILIYACQECSPKEQTPEILVDKLGELFEFNAKVHSYKGRTTTKPMQGKLSYFEIAALPRKYTDDYECPVKKIRIAKTIPRFGNKGAAMIYVKTFAGQNIAFVGVHLDAQKESSRLSNIEAIMNELKKGYKQFDEGTGTNNGEFDHVYIFGDLNYRLIPPSDAPEASECLACISKRACNEDARKKKQGCKWCYEEGKMENSKCAKQGMTCTKVSKNAKEANTLFQCKMAGEPIKNIFKMMIDQKKKTQGAAPSMYHAVRNLDTLWNNMHVWEENHFQIPDYSVDVPPTYKVYYDKTNITKQASSWVTFQQLLEEWPTKATDNTFQKELLSAADAVYQKVRKGKSCSYGHGKGGRKGKGGEEKSCMDFGWLDRLLYRDRDRAKARTAIEMYRNLKMDDKHGYGDHSPIFMQLVSTPAQVT